MKTLKVYGGTFYKKDAKQVRVIVAFYTKKQAVDLLTKSHGRMTPYEFSGWWGETFNDIELSIAIEPGVWESDDMWSSNFTRLI